MILSLDIIVPTVAKAPPALSPHKMILFSSRNPTTDVDQLIVSMDANSSNITISYFGQILTLTSEKQTVRVQVGHLTPAVVWGGGM